MDLESTIYRWRVRAGLMGTVLAIILAQPTLPSFLAGLGISSSGLLLRAWASGYLKKEKELTVSGPYRFTRNPLYLGNLIIGIGMAAASCSWWVGGIFTAYFLLFYPLILKKEKEKMKSLFPKEYETYKNKVPFFFPHLRPPLPSKKNKFSWRIYQKNKEYRALVGTIIFWLFMAAKVLLF
ncbi:MAG: methyltransferase family protein [Candidatus Aminicenantes bacterium]